MVTVRFKVNQDSHIVSVEMIGHAGYAEEGEDIVCSAVSSAIMLTHTLVCDVIGANLITQVDESDPRIYLELTQDSDNRQVQNAFVALMTHLVALKEDYSDFIDVLEV